MPTPDRGGPAAAAARQAHKGPPIMLKGSGNDHGEREGGRKGGRQVASVVPRPPRRWISKSELGMKAVL